MVTKPKSVEPVDGEILRNIEEVERALTKNNFCNVAAIVGKEYNLIAIKFEREGHYSPDLMELLAEFEESLGKLPSTMTIEYSSDEQYRFFEYPADRPIRVTRLVNEITILGNCTFSRNEFVLLEPSDLSGGTVSELSNSDTISKLPEKWIDYICTVQTEELDSDISPVQHPAEDGLKYPPVLDVIQEHKSDEATKDGYSDDDYAAMDEETLLLAIVDQITVFRDEKSDPYFFCDGAPYKAPSEFVEDWVRHQFYKIKKYVPNKKLIRSLFDILESMAKFDSPQIRLFNRVARKEGAIIYDLGNNKCLTTTSTGWEIAASFPQFRRYKHQLEQVIPVSGGNPWEVFDYIAVAEENRLLILVYLIGLFISDIAHPVLAVCGDRGAAKSSLCVVINKLVDPTITEKVIKPNTERDLAQTLRQKYLTVFDNVSKIIQRESDLFCQVCTGGGMSYRQMRSDEGENIDNIRHSVIINSISLPIINADLMDRTIILQLQRVSQDNRKTEQELWDAFEEARPRILGGIFDTLVKSMQTYPTVILKKTPRLADFAKWGYAIAEALGQSGDQFIEDYSKNVTNQNESVIEKNVLCQAVLTLMINKPSIDWPVAQAHSALKVIAGEDAKDSTFPKLPHNLRGHLDQLRSTLLEQGISYQFSSRGNSCVRIVFSNTNNLGTPDTPGTPNVAASQETPNTSASPDTPATPTYASNSLNKMMSVPGVAGVPPKDLPTFDFGAEVYGV